MARRRHARPRELFLAHSGKDRRFVDRLVETLRGRDLRVWFSPTHILGAQQWHDEIGKALRRCDWFSVVLSPDSTRSEWVRRELLYALNQKWFHDRIIPILYMACDAERLSWTLTSLQHVDFTASFDTGIRDLLRIWRGNPER